MKGQQELVASLKKVIMSSVITKRVLEQIEVEKRMMSLFIVGTL